MFVMQGNLRIFTQRGTYLLKEGDIIVLQPNEGHATMMETADTIAAVMHISQKYLEGISSSAQHISACTTVQKNVISLISVFEMHLRLFIGQHPLRRASGVKSTLNPN